MSRASLDMELSGGAGRPGDVNTPMRGVVLAALMVLSACAAGPGVSGVADAAAAARLALAQQDRFAGIRPLDPNLIGQSSWFEVSDAGAGWQVVIRIGWGDCPAGCTSEHRWTYAVGRNGSIALTAETGDDLPDATGVRGTVSAGPTCPVERNPPDPNCAERPVAGAVLVFTDAAGTEVARATSAADGSFRVELAPGAYRVTAQPVDGLMGTPGPIDVVVEAGQQPTEITVSYDTGIR